MLRPSLLLPAGLLLAISMAGSALGQPAEVAAPAETVQSQPAVLQLESPGGGTPHEYQVDDISISVAQSMDGRGESRADVSLSLSQIRPLDAFLLQWVRQGGSRPEASRKAVITVPARQSGTGAETRYELDDARVLGFSASHSASGSYEQVSVQVSVKSISLNGVVMN